MKNFFLSIVTLLAAVWAVSCSDVFSIDDPTISETGVIQMKVGEYYIVNCTDPVNARWTSSNPGVADVDEGVIIAYSPGTAKITVNPKMGKRMSFQVNVEAVPVTKFNIVEAFSLYVGGSEYLEITEVVPSNATVSSLEWESSNVAVMTVEKDENGVKISGLSEGTAKLTGRSKSCSKTSVVTVKGPEKVSLPASVDAYVDSDIEVTAVQEPEVYKDYNWSIRQDGNVCKVRSEGAKAILTGVAPGKCTLELSLAGGSIKKSCEVTVKMGDLVLDKSEHTFLAGDRLRLTATQVPQKYNDYEWVSDDADVASVSEDGNSALVTAGKYSGETVIRCYVNGRAISASCRVKTIGVDYLDDIHLALVVSPIGKPRFLSSLVYVSPDRKDDTELCALTMYGEKLPECFKGRVHWSMGTPSEDGFRTVISNTSGSYEELDLTFTTPIGNRTITYVKGYNRLEVRPFQYVEFDRLTAGERGNPWYKGPNYREGYFQYIFWTSSWWTTEGLPGVAGELFPSTWRTWSGSVKPGDDLLFTGVDDYGDSYRVGASISADGMSSVSRETEVVISNGKRRTMRTEKYGHVSEDITSAKIINGTLTSNGQSFYVYCPVKP